MKWKQIIKKRKELLIERNNLLLKRLRLNKEIKDNRAGLHSIDNLFLTEDLK